MTTVDTVIIGAGQAGLATSWFLQQLGVEHVVFDRGRVGERWRSERWDGLRTLTPNWMSRLPGFDYEGTDPDGFMSMPDVVGRLESYRRRFEAPVIEQAAVCSVHRRGDGFDVVVGAQTWRAHHVVVATGWADRPRVPVLAARLPLSVQQLASANYRNPDQITGGRVLVVGASASGVQIARDLVRTGREVTVAVGRHRRAPRRYRGADVMWWLERIGVLDRRPHDDADRRRLLDEPSVQFERRW